MLNFSQYFSHIRTEYGEILRIFPYSVRMGKIRNGKTPNKTLFTQCSLCSYYAVFLNFLIILLESYDLDLDIGINKIQLRKNNTKQGLDKA